MSSIYDEDDLLVPPGARAQSRPHVALSAAPASVQPKSVATTVPQGRNGAGATLHAVQPTQATGPSSSTGDIVLVPPGVGASARPGVGYRTATAAVPVPTSPRLVVPPSRRTAIWSAFPPSKPPGVALNPAQPRSAQQGGIRRLAGAPSHLPGEEGPVGKIYDVIDQLKDLLEKTHAGEAARNAESLWTAWVRTNWIGAPFTPSQLRTALAVVGPPKPHYLFGKAAADAFARANPPATPNPFEQDYFPGSAAGVLIRRARAIAAELRNTSDGAQVATLEGALSATGLALGIVYPGALYSIPYAGEYIGVGSPAASIEAALSP